MAQTFSKNRMLLMSLGTFVILVLFLHVLSLSGVLCSDPADRTTLDYPAVEKPAQGLDALILVAGHAVYMSHNWTAAEIRDERNWFLEEEQRGQVATYLRHIEAGVTAAAADPFALLLFTGGETRLGAGPRSEAQSYWMLSDALGWFGYPEVKKRAYTEEHARDSFENLAFSVCRFRELTGRYPDSTTVISFQFKEHRFMEMHAAALSLRPDTLHYIGIDPPDMGDLSLGELNNAVTQFEDDPKGCHNAELRAKRSQRNPFDKKVPYPDGCPEMSQVILRCDETKVDYQQLP